MELEKIRSLAGLLDEFGLEELKIEGEVTLRRPSPQVASFTAPIPMESIKQNAPVVNTNTETSVTTEQEEDVFTVTSPMVGMFYAAPAPNEPAFVSVGQEVKAGDVLCVIEAMKLMNEIVAEQDGIITKCFHGNEQVVEFGQALFQMRCN